MSEIMCSIQYKGSDICIDLECECGAGGHYDGFFCYGYKCPDCGNLYQLSDKIVAKKIESWPESMVEPVEFVNEN